MVLSNLTPMSTVSYPISVERQFVLFNVTLCRTLIVISSVIGHQAYRHGDILLYRKPIVTAKATLSDKQQGVFYISISMEPVVLCNSEVSRYHNIGSKQACS